MGFVAPRYSRRAVTAALDGHALPLGLNPLQDNAAVVPSGGCPRL
jgi:hypothetical protein